MTVHVPDIGGVLPVYVADRLQGLRGEDLSRAHRRRARALPGGERCGRARRRRDGPAGSTRRSPTTSSWARRSSPGPASAAADGGPGYAVKVHGSALEFTVKPNPRFLPYARAGLEPASAVLAGSRHTAESLWAALDDPGLPARTRLGPPGVDLELFAPIEARATTPALRALAGELRSAATDADAAFARDPGEAAVAVAELAEASGGRVVFVGKLIDTKGVDLLLAAWPVVLAANPGARLLIAGFGEGRDRIERFAAALAAGDLRAARELAGGAADEQAWKMTDAFLANPPEGYARLAGEAAADRRLRRHGSSTTRSASWCPPATPW